MKPIIFSAEMVSAILEGRKTQTRRVIKPQPAWINSSGRWCWPIPKTKRHKGCCDEVVTASREWWEYLSSEQLPYQSGDILWVRETWCHADTTDEIIYKSDNPSLSAKWRPSICMPRKAARLFLRVKNVRVERLQDIAEIEATHEGIIKHLGIHARNDFSKLWDSIYGKRGYGWDTNPWVWVIDFERRER